MGLKPTATMAALPKELRQLNFRFPWKRAATTAK